MSEITTMAELMGEVLRLRQQLFDEHSLHVASQLCLKAQTESVQGCAQKLAEVTKERDFYKKASRTAGYDALLSCGHTYEENVANVFAQWKQAIDDALNAERQLAEVTQERDMLVKGVAPRRSPGPVGVSVQKGDV